MCFRRFALSFLVLLTGSSALLRADIVYNFNADAIGKATSFTDTVSGVGATFSSSGDPGGFVVAPTFFSTLTGNVLFDPGPAGLDNLTLTIFFSVPQTSVSMNFATNSAPGVLFNLNAFNGASGVGSTSAAGSIPAGGFFPEGVITFSGPAFDKVALSSPALDFAIDNVTVSAVPEPGSLLLLLLMFGTLVIVSRFPWLVSKVEPSADAHSVTALAMNAQDFKLKEGSVS